MAIKFVTLRMGYGAETLLGHLVLTSDTLHETPQDAIRSLANAFLKKFFQEVYHLNSCCKKGKREDLGGVFFRSSWEANYARILNHLGVRWQYEPETFEVGEAETYTPDFKLADGTFVEIKGWWTEASKRKIELFRDKFPDIKLETITKTEYIALSKQYRYTITNWE